MRHHDLLNALINFIVETWNEDIEIMYIDHEFCESNTQPPKIGKYIPDVYAIVGKGTCIVGEAKTINDFESERSQSQLLCFLEYSSRNNCCFCTSVPFIFHRSVSSRLEYVIKANNLNINGYVVHEFGSRRLRCKQ